MFREHSLRLCEHTFDLRGAKSVTGPILCLMVSRGVIDFATFVQTTVCSRNIPGTREQRSLELMSLILGECVAGIFQEQDQPEKIHVSQDVPQPMIKRRAA